MRRGSRAQISFCACGCACQAGRSRAKTCPCGCQCRAGAAGVCRCAGATPKPLGCSCAGAPRNTWSRDKPQNSRARRDLKKNCGARCFLGPNLSFPVCNRDCAVNPSGVAAAARLAALNKARFANSDPSRSTRYARVQRDARRLAQLRGGAATRALKQAVLDKERRRGSRLLHLRRSFNRIANCWKKPPRYPADQNRLTG